jgi:hypothetical protein
VVGFGIAGIERVAGIAGWARERTEAAGIDDSACVVVRAIFDNKGDLESDAALHGEFCAWVECTGRDGNDIGAAGDAGVRDPGKEAREGCMSGGVKLRVPMGHERSEVACCNRTRGG